jgi:hypothetical protein
MNWDAIGAVGEMIGSLAVVVTLVYLAVQVRASTVESEASHFYMNAEQIGEMRGRFMEHADVWVKGNAGGELSASERFVFDELVTLKGGHHFTLFRRTLVRGTGREGIHVAEIAEFFHRYPAAYRIWRSQVESTQLARRRLDVFRDDRWPRAVTEAVAALEGMEESAGT